MAPVGDGNCGKESKELGMKQRKAKKGISNKELNRRLFRRTLVLLGVLGVLGFVPMVLKLVQLQIVQHETWSQKAVNQQTVDTAVNAQRGGIYDNEGESLAVSATAYNLILSPYQVIASVDEDDYESEALYQAAIQAKRQLVVDGMVELLGADPDRMWKRIERTDSQYEVLAYEMEEDEVEDIRTFIKDNKLSGILYLSATSKRYYPQASIASHVVGYISENEFSGGVKVGAQGLEAAYQKELSGEKGRILRAQRGGGGSMLVDYEEYLDGQQGYNLNLTLNTSLQALAEQTLAEGIETYEVKNGGFCIIMDPSTGAILAMASSPDYDPNQYATVVDEHLRAELEAIREASGSDSEDYSQALSDAINKQWRNKALSDTYEPGSTFKALVVAAALEEGVISMDDHYYCGGASNVGGYTVHCHKHSGHGDQTLTQAVENSCNVALMEIGSKLGAETLWRYFEEYGLFDKTGIDLAGEGTSVFWSKEDFTGPYGAASVAVASFGQTFKITPIQMISAFASVINGGHLLTPYMVQSISDADGNTTYYHEVEEKRQVLSEETSEKLRGILESVVANGSGRNAYMTGYRIAGKTGTSEKIGEEGDDVICSFMGFAPVDDPQVLVLLAFDSPERSAPGSNYTPSGTYISGGNIAAPMAGQLIANALDYLGVEKQYTAEELSGADVTMSHVVGYELTVAKGLLADRGIRCRTVGTGNTVTGQVPRAGVSLPGGSEVILYLGEEVPQDQVEMPDITGMSLAKAKETLEAKGIFLRAAGVSDYTDATLTASSQGIAPGTMVAMGTVVDVRFVSSVVDYDGAVMEASSP